MISEVYEGAIDDLVPDWTALFAADPEATPYTSPAWARAWLRVWAPDCDPMIVTVRDRGELVALAPLVIRRKGPLRLLQVLGKEPGDYWDLIAQPAVRRDAASLVAEELARRAARWDVFVLDSLPQGSVTEWAFVWGLRVRRRAPVSCPGIPLPASFEEYLATLPSRRRSNLRKHLRKLDSGAVRMRSVTDPSELVRAIERWHELRIRRWDEMGKTIDAEHRSRRFHDFMLEAVLSLVPAGLADVSEFEYEGRVAGVYVNLVDDRTFYWYLGGFDPELASLGIGKISVTEGIRSSIAAGRRYFDFTRGSEPFKYHYGAIDRHSASLVLGNDTARSRSALLGATLGDTARARIKARPLGLTRLARAG